MMKKLPALIPTKELREGDIVRCGGEFPYDHATVKKTHRDGSVTLFRPYVRTADFTYTGGVVCYIGFEEFTINKTTNCMLLRESDLPKQKGSVT